jgi:Transmembrane protein 43
MSDSFVETTSTSWLSRIWQSITGVLFGLLFIIGAIVLLFWNEGRAIQTQRSLTEGGKVVIDVTPDPIDAANDGKLIHVSGNTRSTAPLVDPEFAVSAVGLHLVRIAEMYQWEEEKHEETHKSLGGSEQTTTTYSYNKVWSDRAIDSQKFRQRDNHTNPAKKYARLSVTSTDAALGAFRLDAPVLNLLPTNTEVRVAPQTAAKIKPRIANAQVVDGKIYLGADAGDPQIGDYRISYVLAPAGPVSVIGRQAASTITQYQTTAGDRLLMAVDGMQSATEMFKEAERENRILTWAIRAGGILAMWLGAFLIFRPLVVVADVVPLIGGVLGAGAGLVALVFAIVAGSIVIAIAWLWYRPIVSLIVLAIGGAVAFILHRLAARRSAAAGGPPKPAAA